MTRLLLALIIFVPVVIFAFNFFFHSSDAQKSLDSVSSKIDEFVKSGAGGLDSVTLRVEKNGGIFFFTSDSDMIVAERHFMNSMDVDTEEWNAGAHSLKSFEVLRPANCEEGKSCVCVCPEKFVDSKGKTRSNNEGSGVEVMTCKDKMLCKSFKSVSFDSESHFNYPGGFLYSNPSLSLFNEGVYYTGGFFLVPDSNPKTLFILKAGSLFCFSPYNDVECV